MEILTEVNVLLLLLGRIEVMIMDPWSQRIRGLKLHFYLLEANCLLQQARQHRIIFKISCYFPSSLMKIIV